jgi:prepilin-type N-terminal cleavage/methylation domain-containing protein
MITALHRNRAGFTLVEVLIVVAIIALLAAICVPNYLRARKRSQATRTLEDLRILDYALDRWAIEKNKTGGDTATIADLRPYLKDADTSLYTAGTDVLGNAVGPFVVDVAPRVPDATFDALSDVAPAAFWSPYR